jgi:23S rRNA (adenine2503-C2)-methyltransferase
LPRHADRLWNYLYLQLTDSFEGMPELPPKVRARLAAGWRIGTLATAVATDSSDGFTRKYLLKLTDEARIETVLMRFTGRVTACISSQVGCAMGCVFCATGQMGYTRHLTPARSSPRRCMSPAPSGPNPLPTGTRPSATPPPTASATSS